MNFEQLKLQMHMRRLYEQLGAMDAELMIVDAFLREQARHDKIAQSLHAHGRSLSENDPTVA